MYALICEIIFFITWGGFLHRLFKNLNNRSTGKDQIQAYHKRKLLNIEKEIYEIRGRKRTPEETGPWRDPETRETGET
jgi:hypothetical protein